jgi:hypothetical protein
MMKKEGSKKEVKGEGPKKQDVLANKPPPKTPVPAKNVVVLKNKTEIAARLQKAVKEAKPVNRSSDLVPLNRDYVMMRKDLKELIAAAKQYQGSILRLDKARMDVRFVAGACLVTRFLSEVISC